ncbi:bifunctional N(6)-L-threonylcarbamoyladenine synthase/serine/threonine protein kinase [Candidatus Woesearchaeota archaeon]|nr:bifunctional N(6)-L-threonylcarbamoyladenine synthase/serine/threonine protein kinase [Candidatus Woesearchaeota archaeon]
MICLGIESTAHTFGIGIVKDKAILANEKDSFTTTSGGMIPNEVAEHHKKVANSILNQALAKAKIKIENVDVIAFSQGPGLDPALLVGRDFALKLSKNKPLIGINHCVAHLEIGQLTGAKDPVLLYASGANTQIIAYEAGKYRIFGETLDQGIGNVLDSFARHIGLGFPGGPKIAELAKNGKKLIELPYNVKGMDVNFGGILTKCKQLYDRKQETKEDICFSLQETVFAMLVEVAERAMAHTNKKELLLGGGVACNKRLQEMCKIMCKERNAKFFIPENQYLVDQGAMIAYLGLIEYKAKVKTTTEIKPHWRTDQVEVTWK